jgi:hypothetical protein
MLRPYRNRQNKVDKALGTSSQYFRLFVIPAKAGIHSGVCIRVISLAPCAIRDIRVPNLFFFGCDYAALRFP